MKKILILLNVLILCFTITGCNSSSKNDLTDEQIDLLTSTHTIEDTSNLLQDMKDDGYNFELNPETLELVVSKKENKISFSPIENTGNYTFIFSDKNGSYEKEESLIKDKVNISDENRETITNLISILEKFNVNLNTLELELVGYYKDNLKSLNLSRLDSQYPIREKLRQAGYSENDYKYEDILPTWSKVITSSDGSSSTRTFDMTSGIFSENSSNVTTEYNWHKNTGKVYKYASYDFNTNSVTSTVSLSSQEEATFVIQMMYIEQEFNKELSLINTSIDELNEYKMEIN